MRTYIDTARSDAPLEALTVAAAVYLGFTVLAQALAVGATYLGESVARRATNALRYDLAGHCLDLDMSFHTAHTPGELLERIDGDVSALAGF
jgi:ATP-binding cassette subfamily B protein